MNKIKHYLIVAPSWIGDMVMAQSLFLLLKNNDPTCIIDVLAPKSTIDLLKFMPEVNQVILAPFKRKKLEFKKRFLLGKSLKNKGHTDAIVLVNSWKSALVPFFAGIKNRVGFKGESRYFLLNDLRKLDKDLLPLMIERFCFLGVNKQSTPPTELPWPKLRVGQNKASEYAKKFSHLDQSNLIAFCPGAEYGPAKRWPEKYFANTALELTKMGYKIVLLGGSGDREIANAIVEVFKNQSEPDRSDHLIDLVAKTSIDEVVWLLSKVRAVLSNDTGLMHIANAFEKPTLVIYGSSSASFTPPLNKNAKSIYLNLDCRPCFKRTCPLIHMNCLNKLTPDLVLEKFREVL